MSACNFREDWLENVDTNGDSISIWCLNNDSVLSCKWCNLHKTINYSSKGLGALSQHVKTKQHKKSRSMYFSTNQLRLSQPSTSSSTPSSTKFSTPPSTQSIQPTSEKSQQLGVFFSKTLDLHKEIVWMIHLLMKNSSLVRR